MSGLAIVMSGGGALSAYQAGCLSAIAAWRPRLDVPILTGVSAGAINAVVLASSAGDFRQRVEGLVNTWTTVTVDQVFQVGMLRLLHRALRWGVRLLSGGVPSGPRPRSMVDTAPLRVFLQRILHSADGTLPQIARNLDEGTLTAVAMTASSYGDSRSVTWVQGRGVACWDRGDRVAVPAVLTIDHVMASAALPLLFPAVEVDGAWYGDGSVLLTAPLSPAVHLGASRILAISTRSRRNHVTNGEYPPPAQVAGAILNALFLDQLDADALRLQQINDLVAPLPVEQRHGLRPVDLLVLRPSRDLGQLATEHEPRLPRALRFLTRGLGTRETRQTALLSLLMFQRDYIERLVAQGREDAGARRAEIEAFLFPESGAQPRS